MITTASVIHVAGPGSIRHAWKSHFVGDLRAVNNSFLDTYQLKSQNALVDGNIERIERGNGGYLVTVSFARVSEVQKSLRYDRVIVCTGFRFDASIFDEQCRPELVIRDRFPAKTSQWESINVPDLYFAGTLIISTSQIAPMTARDFTSDIASFISLSHSLAPASVSKAMDIAGRNHWHSLRHAYFVWLLICTAVVALGVVLEEIKPRVMGAIDPVTGFRAPRPIISVIARRIATVGWILIVVGVIGEGAFEALVAGADSHLQEITDGALGTAITQVGILEKQAEGLRKEAEDERSARVELEASVSWRRLTKQQKFAIGTKLATEYAPELTSVWYTTGDAEGSSFAADIAEILSDGKMWVVPPLTLPISNEESAKTGDPIKRWPTGVKLASTKDVASRSLAKVLAKELNDRGFDSGMDAIINAPGLLTDKQPSVMIVVCPRPQGPQGEAKLRAEAKKKQQATTSQDDHHCPCGRETAPLPIAGRR